MGDTVLVRDGSEASQIYNKGYYGYPVSGGGLELDLLEAAYLLESGRLEVVEGEKELGFSEFNRIAASRQEGFGSRLIVYRDLRQRGYVVKSYEDHFDFRVFPRGGTPATSETKYWVIVLSERSIFDILSLTEELSRVERTRKELLLAVVDEEGDITFYKAQRGEPRGSVEARPESPAQAVVVEDRVLIFDEEMGDLLHRSGYFGKKIGSTLQLSLIETAFLMEGCLEVRNAATGRKISPVGFRKRAVSLQPDFDLRLRAYSDLRSRGLVVKTGFKYGCHFRVYEKDPQKVHARYLVHAVPERYETSWPEISRAVRLAHGVKKEILFGQVAEQGMRYLRMKRVRP